jgi:hypothetical protein
MDMTAHPDVERIPNDFDRFLGSFFSRRGWRSEIKFDPAENLLYLVVRLGDRRLSGDDRFFSLVEYFGRSQSATLRRTLGPQLRLRLLNVDGSDLTTQLHQRGARCLDDREQGPAMRRRLVTLGMRRRLLTRFVPNALLWAVAMTFVVVVLGLSLGTAVWLGAGALLVQMLVVVATSRVR